MRVTIVGTGYVGLVSGTCFAEFGAEVTCVDNNATKVENLKQGIMPIYEPGLEEMVKRNCDDGRLHFTTDLKSAVKGADAVFIAVGTPSHPETGHADLKYVYAAAEEIAAGLSGYTVIVDKSTVPVGTGAEVEKIIRAKRPDAQFDVCSNPEFLREGCAIDDFMKPDRVVIGTSSDKARAVLQKLYQGIEAQGYPIMFTQRETAELIKYANNAFLALKLTFINEIANLCEMIGADVQDVATGIGMDSRIGAKFLQAGPGYGGSCFPKDTMALIKTAQDYGTQIRLIEETVSINNERKAEMATRVTEALGGSVKGKKIAVLGVAFKANTDDMRESPALDIVPALQKAGADIHAYDPAAMHEAAKLMPGVNWGTSALEICDNADAIVIVTEWKEFAQLDLAKLHGMMATPVMVDLRNMYQPQQVVDAGFVYRSIGRPTPVSAEALEEHVLPQLANVA